MKKEVSSKNIIGIFILFIFVGGLFSFFIYSDYHSIKKISVDKYGNNNVLFSFDYIQDNPKDKDVSIKGWAFKKNQNLRTVNTYVTLRNKNTSQVFKINTIKEERKDVTLLYNDSYNYDHSGLFAQFNKNVLKDKGEYEICILYLSDNNTDFVPTGKFININ